MTTYHVMRRSEAEIHQFAAKGTYLAEMTCSKIFWSNINQKYSVKDLGFINWARNRGLGWGVRYLGKFFKLKEPPPPNAQFCIWPSLPRRWGWVIVLLDGGDWDGGDWDGGWDEVEVGDCSLLTISRISTGA